MNSRPLIVNVDCNFEYPLEQKTAAAHGADLVLKKAVTEDEIIAACAEAAIVLVEEANFTARVIANLKQCQVIHMYGIGVDTIDVAAATERGIVVANAADYGAESVSDHAVALLLACVRRVTTMDRNIRRGGWFDFQQETPLRQVKDLTLGLIGAGRIARGVAAKMGGFRMRILAYDRYVPADQGPPGVEMTTLDRVVRESDLISIHTPLTAETRGMIGESVLRAMKPTAMLVNTGRGAVVDENVLVRALREKWIAGAGLDVMVKEPLPMDSPLREFENVVLTPHYGGVSVEARARVHELAVDSIQAVLQGYWPLFPVNPQVRPRKPLAPRPKS